MKQLLIIAVLALVSCGESQEAINKKRTQDSLVLAMRQTIVKDSIHKVNSKRISDSIADEITKSMNSIQR